MFAEPAYGGLASSIGFGCAVLQLRPQALREKLLRQGSVDSSIAEEAPPDLNDVLFEAYDSEAAKSQLQQKMHDGHLLSADELAELEEVEASEIRALRTRMNEGHLLTADEFERLEYSEAADVGFGKLQDGHMLTASSRCSSRLRTVVRSPVG